MPALENILQGDFAENYSYVVQDEIQSFHWENKQATLHPFVAYHKLDDEDGTLEHRNICVVNDIKEHSISTVYAFQQVVIEYINPIRSGLFQTVNDPGGGFKSPPLRSRKLLCQSSLYHTCEFYQVFLA